MAVYDISGNALSLGMENVVTVKKNNEVLVDDFLTVARSYLNQTSITYKDGDTVFYKDTATNGIDCSTYVGLCLMGYAFEDTPYYTGDYHSIDSWVENSAHNWALNVLGYKCSRFIDGHNPDERVRLACQMARWMIERGQSVPMDNGFRDVMPGDIVWWGHKKTGTDEWVRPDWYLHINHIGIVLSKENAPDTFVSGGVTYNWDKTKYPFKHQIIEVTALTPPPCVANYWLERGQEDTTNIYQNNVNTIVAICRPDLGALSDSIN